MRTWLNMPQKRRTIKGWEIANLNMLSSNVNDLSSDAFWNRKGNLGRYF